MKYLILMIKNYLDCFWNVSARKRKAVASVDGLPQEWSVRIFLFEIIDRFVIVISMSIMLYFEPSKIKLPDDSLKRGTSASYFQWCCEKYQMLTHRIGNTNWNANRIRKYAWTSTWKWETIHFPWIKAPYSFHSCWWLWQFWCWFSRVWNSNA